MKALVRRPSPRVADGLVTFIERRPVDGSLASSQWAGYVAALEAAGWETVEVEPADDCPDGVFIEDTLVVRRGIAVIARPGAESRRQEVEAVEAAIASLGYSPKRIEPPGTLDGGDVLQVGDTVYVGTGGRTNPEGARQLRAILEPLGATVLSVPVRKVLHLKSAVTALPTARSSASRRSSRIRGSSRGSCRCPRNPVRMSSTSAVPSCCWRPIARAPPSSSPASATSRRSSTSASSRSSRAA